jgi:hypothetical protein
VKSKASTVWGGTSVDVETRLKVDTSFEDLLRLPLLSPLISQWAYFAKTGRKVVTSTQLDLHLYVVARITSNKFRSFALDLEICSSHWIPVTHTVYVDTSTYLGNNCVGVLVKQCDVEQRVNNLSGKILSFPLILRLASSRGSVTRNILQCLETHNIWETGKTQAKPFNSMLSYLTKLPYGFKHCTKHLTDISCRLFPDLRA